MMAILRILSMEEWFSGERSREYRRDRRGVKPQRHEYTGNRSAVEKDAAALAGQPNLASKNRFRTANYFYYGLGNLKLPTRVCQGAVVPGGGKGGVGVGRGSPLT